MWKFVHVVVVGISIYLLLLVGFPDACFKSPIEKGMTPVKSIETPLSKRVVLMIMDGLRVHCFLNKRANVTPFLTSVRETRGAWGISHSRIPTQSRPSLLAIIAGFHEEPSPALKNWMDFPEKFDTVLNESKHAWLLGPEDTTKGFKTNAKHVKRLEFYWRDLVDETKNLSSLDQWPFQKLKNILNNTNETKALDQGVTTFSLILTSLDVVGHKDKPHSKPYLDTIKFADKIIESVEILFNKRFKDNMTTFIFTSDHGMTDWGAHGAGSDEETFTPFVIWGAGVKINKTRQDTNQINIASLISVILGINYPMNSVGMVPTCYVNLSVRDERHVFLTNLRQLFEILEMKQDYVKKNWPLFKSPYLSRQEFDEKISKINQTVYFETFKKECNLLGLIILDGIEYYNRSFTLFILACLVMGLFFWTLYLVNLTIPASDQTIDMQKRKMIFLILYILICTLMAISYILAMMPFLYYLYILFPITTFFLFMGESNVFRKCLFFIKSYFVNYYQINSVIIFVSTAIISIYLPFCVSLVIIFGVFVSTFKTKHFQKDFNWCCVWYISTFVLSIFTLLPYILTEYSTLHVALGFLFWYHFFLVILWKKLYEFNEKVDLTKLQKIIFFVQIICLNWNFLIKITNGKHNLFWTWTSILVSLFCVPFSMVHKGVRFLTILMGCVPFYLSTTLSYEMIFLTFYSAVLFLWIFIEPRIESGKNDPHESYRTSFMFTAFVLVGYFGPGNVSYLNSFDPSWVVGTLLNDFIEKYIIALILLKLTLPIFFTSCAFRYVSVMTGRNIHKSFYTIFLIFHLMVVYFALNLKKETRYGDVASRLSRFVVVNYFTLAVLFYYFLASILTTISIDLRALFVILKNIWYNQYVFGIK